jgi:hypothetical protein
VHFIQRKLCSFLSGKLKDFTKSYYVSDSDASQHKNKKNFISLHYCKDYFAMGTVGHFFAISHYKGACDGIARTIKMPGREESLQNHYEQQMMTSRQPYEWDIVKIPQSPLITVLRGGGLEE